jgi:multicomponent Na+:H+ antiporter subunit A
MAAALAATFTQRRFASVAYMGVIGLSVTLLFLVFGAPDLAMTQFVVDTLTVILLALVLHRLPDAGERVKGLGRLFDVALAAAAGIVMFLFVLLSTSKDTMLPSISKYFAQNSLSAAHGRNIVNVILVDFRAIDTLGEITVLAVSAIGVYSLLKLVLREKKPNP